MDYIFHITVHAYAEEKLNDNILTLHSRNYGIIDKRIIRPLRRINDKKFCIADVQDTFSVEELWNYIDCKLYANISKSEDDNILNYVQKHNVVQKYLIFNKLRYRVENTKTPILYYLHRMEVSEKETINIQLLINSNAGTIFKDDGIRYYMPSKEYGKHSTPHVHVDIRHEISGSFSLIDGRKLAGGSIRKRDLKSIEKMIMSRNEEFLKYWKEHTDGLTADLNQALELIEY